MQLSVRYSHIAVCLILTGCSGFSLPGQINESIQRENQAWAAEITTNNFTCKRAFGSSNDGSLKRKDALKAYYCEAALIRKNILPVAVYPDLLDDLDAQMARTAKKYYEGKINSHDYLRERRETSAEYNKKCQMRIREQFARLEQRRMGRMQFLEAQTASDFYTPSFIPRQALQSSMPPMQPCCDNIGYDYAGESARPQSTGIGGGARGYDGRIYIPFDQSANPGMNSSGYTRE